MVQRFLRLLGDVSFWGTLATVLGVVAVVLGALSTSSTSLRDIFMLFLMAAIFSVVCCGIAFWGAAGKHHQSVHAPQDDLQQQLDEARAAELHHRDGH